MNLNAIMKNRSKAAYITLACAAVSLVTLIVFCIYGAVFNYFDVMVMLDLLFGAICFAGYFVFKNVKWTRFLNLLGVAFVAFALCFFFLNSYPVWADELNGITMYNSRGGLFPVISIIVLMLIVVIAGIVTCFKKEEEEE